MLTAFIAGVWGVIVAAWSFVGYVAPTLGSIGGVVAAILTVRNLLINRRTRIAAESAETQSTATAVSATATTAVVTALQKRIDDMFTVVLHHEHLNLRLKRIEQYLAEHEAERRSVHAAPTDMTEPEGALL